jgi:GTP-binding protein HflX
MEDHVRTVMKVLEELGLLDIPRLLVLNKTDLVEPAELRLLGRTHPDAVLVSATHRETMRPLIERIARELAEKWEYSAKGPRVEPEVSLDEEARPDGEGEAEMTTVDEMLRAAGKRVRVRAV